MTSVTDKIISKIIDREGAFVHDPADRGGATNYGITQQTLSIWLGWDASVADVRALTKDGARKIYRSLYVTEPGFDQIADPPLRAQVIDTGVLHGTGFAIRALQDVLSVEVDGIIGPVTLKAVNIDGRLAGLRARFLGRRLHRIARIVQKDPSQLKYLTGWIDRASSVFIETEG
jgi:lysozyme family protein